MKSQFLRDGFVRLFFLFLYIMFDLIPNYQVRDISGELSVEELVQTLKNPSIIQKKIVDMARKVGKHNYPYDKIKGALPCFIPFYRHNNKVNKGTLKKSTNYIYIDIDEDVSFDPSQHNFVVACWKSLSGNGKGVLISVD